LDILLVVIAVLALISGWRRYRRPALRATVVAAAVLTAACAVLSSVNVYELMFHPMATPAFAQASTTKLDGAEKVIAVTVRGSARAYPIRIISYHHIVNDVLAGLPIVATY
jgi:hypothetical protein